MNTKSESIFTTPVAMRCTHEQYIIIKPKLETLGYTVPVRITANYKCYIINNFRNNIGELNIISAGDKTNYNRIVLEEWNEELYLALAAMTNISDGINGEYLECIKSTRRPGYTKGKLYKKLHQGVIHDVLIKALCDGSDNFTRMSRVIHKSYFVKPSKHAKHNIENYSSFIEKVIIEKIKNAK